MPSAEVAPAARFASAPHANRRTLSPHSWKLLARDEYDRCWRLFEHGRGGVAEEQLVARAAAYPHDDQVVPALLHLGEDRLVWRHVSVHGGSRRHVVAVGHFDDVPHDRLLLLAGAEAATLASVTCAGGGNVERRDRTVAGAREGDRDVGRPARYLVSGHRHEDVQRTLLRVPEMIAAPGHDCERPLEGRSDAADVLMKAAVLDARVFDAHDEKVVSL